MNVWNDLKSIIWSAVITALSQNILHWSQLLSTFSDAASVHHTNTSWITCLARGSSCIPSSRLLLSGADVMLLGIQLCCVTFAWIHRLICSVWPPEAFWIDAILQCLTESVTHTKNKQLEGSDTLGGVTINLRLQLWARIPPWLIRPKRSKPITDHWRLAWRWRVWDVGRWASRSPWCRRKRHAAAGHSWNAAFDRFAVKGEQTKGEEGNEPRATRWDEMATTGQWKVHHGDVR